MAKMLKHRKVSVPLFTKINLLLTDIYFIAMTVFSTCIFFGKAATWTVSLAG